MLPTLQLTEHGYIVNTNKKVREDVDLYDSYTSFGAEFRLTYEEALELCHSYVDIRTPKQAAARVEKLARVLAKHYDYEIVES